MLDLLGKAKLNPFISVSMSMSVDLDVASEFICCVYVQSKTRDVNEVRYNKRMQMIGKVDPVIKA